MASVVGCDGFGFAKKTTKRRRRWHKIVQSGNVVIESDAELQANTCIDRASIGETRIGRGTKLDNLVHVGHSCIIGHDTLALRPGGPGRHHRRRQQRNSGRTSRRQRPRKNRRRSHSHSPKRHPARRSRRSHGQRRSRHRSQIVVEVLRRLRQAARTGQSDAGKNLTLTALLPSGPAKRAHP